MYWGGDIHERRVEGDGREVVVVPDVQERTSSCVDTPIREPSGGEYGHGELFWLGIFRCSLSD